MPISKNPGESKDEFISRCIAKEVSSGMDTDQAAAVCYTYWNELKSATASGIWSGDAPVSVEFSKRKVLFNEDFSEEEVKRYKDLGFKVLIRSRRKYKKKDKKVWNKLKSCGLTEDHLVFGEVEQLHKKYNFDLLMTGQDPVLEKLMCSGADYSKWRVIKSQSVNSYEEALQFEKTKSDVELKFITIKTVYSYRERPGVAPAASGSRPFCERLMNSNRKYTINEIMDLGTKHLTDMGLPADPFLYRGGFYTTPGGRRGPDTTPYCRHEWVAEIVIEP